MVDKKRDVEISFKVTGVDKNVFSSITKSLKTISDVVEGVTKKFNTFKTSIESISVPKNLSSFSEELKKLGDNKITGSLKNLAEGFEKLKEIKTPPNLSEFSTELKKLSNISVTGNLNGIAEGFKKLDEIKKPINLSEFRKELKKLSGFSLPNLKNITDGLADLAKIDLAKNNIGGKIRVLARNLQKFSGISVPDFKKFADGLKLLVDTNFKGFTSKINSIVTALKKLTGIKDLELPKISSFVTGIKALVSLDISKLSTNIKRLNDEIKKLDKAGKLDSFKSFASDLQKISKVIEKTGDSIERTNKKVRTFGDRIRTYVQYRVVADAVMFLKDAFYDSLTTIKEYDQALKDLQAITGATTLEVAQMGDKIKEVASNTKFSASEVAEGMRIIGQAGFSAAESVQVIGSVSDLATGTLTAMSTTVDLVTTSIRVFGKQAGDSREVVDVFANAVNRSKLTIDKLRTSMNYVGPVAKNAGVSLQEMATAMATLANSGLRASTIGTGLRRVFAELISPGKALTAAAQNSGVALQELDPRVNSLQSVLSNLGLVLKDSGVAFEIFGKRGAAAALALAGADSNYASMLSIISESGTAAKQAEIQMQGLGVSFKNLQDKVKNLYIAIGDAGLTEALRTLINVTRVLVDWLTTFTNTTLGAFIVNVGLATAAVVAFGAALSYLSKVPFLVGIAGFLSNVPQFLTSFSAMTAGIRLLGAGIVGIISKIHPAVAAITAAITAVQLFNTYIGKSSHELDKLNGKLSPLTDQFKDYEVAIASAKGNTEEIAKVNKAFRESLLKVAKEFPEVSKEAEEAANSINPFTGEINKSSIALAKYANKIEKLRFDSLSNQIKKLNYNIKGSGLFFNRTVKGMYDTAKNVFGNLIGVLDIDFSSQIVEANKMAKAISDGSVSFRDLAKYVEELDFSNLTTQQEDIVENYKLLSQEASKFVGDLIKAGKIDLEDSVEEFRAVAESAGATGIILDSFVTKFENLKHMNEGTFSNIIEKWAHDGENAISDFIVEYDNLNNSIAEGEKENIKLLEAKQAGLVRDLEKLKERRKAEKDAGKDIRKVWEDYYADERVLLQKAEAVRYKIAESRVYQNTRILKDEKAKLDKHLTEIEARYKGNIKKIVLEREKALREYRDKEKRLLAGEEIDPKKQVAEYKLFLQERVTAYERHVYEISLLQSQGKLSEEEANKQKIQAEISMYDNLYAQAVSHRNKIDKLKNPVEYDKRDKEVSQAEEKLYHARAKALITYTDLETKSANKLEKLDDDLQAEREKNVSKRESNAANASRRLITLEKQYADKIVTINKKLEDKLEEIKKKRERNEKDANADILGLETSAEEKIRQIRQRGLSDAQKDAKNRLAAQKYLSEGTKAIRDAEETNDKDLLEHGVALIKQSEDIGSSLKSQGQAIGFVQKALEQLKKARNVEKEIKDLALLAEAQKAEADAEAERVKAAKDYDFKVKNAKAAIAEISATEKIRHELEMKNLNDEIKKWEEKARIAKETLSSIGPVNLSSPTGSSKDVSGENERHAIEMENTALETRAIMDKYNEARKGIESYSDSQEAQNETLEDTEKILESINALAAEISSDQAIIGLTADSEDVGDVKDTLADVKKDIEDIHDIADDPANLEFPIDPKVFEEVDYLMVGIQRLEDDHDIPMEVMIENMKELDGLIEKLEKLDDETITVTVRPIVKNSNSNIPGLATGGRLPGYGGGDRRLLLGEDGEWMINKHAVRKYGDAFMNSLNNMSFPKFQTGGPITDSAMKSASKFVDSPLKNFGEVLLDTGVLKVPALINTDTLSDLETKLLKAKRFAT